MVSILPYSKLLQQQKQQQYVSFAANCKCITKSTLSGKQICCSVPPFLSQLLAHTEQIFICLQVNGNVCFAYCDHTQTHTQR